LPLPSGTSGADYLACLREGLERLRAGARLAFVVTGTDVLASDPLEALGLSVEQCAERDRLVVARLKQLGVPAVFLAGGGHGKQSADAMIAGLQACRDVA
jgi:histone deacetylase 11